MGGETKLKQKIKRSIQAAVHATSRKQKTQATVGTYYYRRRPSAATSMFTLFLTASAKECGISEAMF